MVEYNLSSIESSIPYLSKNYVKYLPEASIVCFEITNHVKNTIMAIDGLTKSEIRFHWNSVDQITKKVTLIYRKQLRTELVY